MTDDYNTLDYPPSFGYFEKLLGLSHKLVYGTNSTDMCLSLLSGEDAKSQMTPACISFQRLSVTASTILTYCPAAFYAVYSLALTTNRTIRATALMYDYAFLVMSIPLILLDCIHFQYNAYLTSYLLVTLTLLSPNTTSNATTTKTALLSAVSYSLLITSKHLYITLAPCIFVYLLSNYCLPPTLSPANKLIRFVTLGVVTLTSIAAPFLQFIRPTNAAEDISQILSRLFPVSRGLTHAYWAPNVWSLYSFADRVLLKLANRFPALIAVKDIEGGGTSGIISDRGLAVLPNLTPLHCILFILILTTPFLIKAYKQPYKKNTFLMLCLITSYTTYMLGYHVHEKAIITTLTVLQLLVISNDATSSTTDDGELARLCNRVNVVGLWSFMPLFLEGGFKMTVVKYGLLVVGVMGTTCYLSYKTKEAIVKRVDVVVGVGVLGALFSYTEIVHPAFLGDVEAVAFLPLMLTSVGLAVLNVGLYGSCWKLSWDFFDGVKEKVP
jgi:alpha-1,3-glucosyltransferase